MTLKSPEFDMREKSGYRLLSRYPICIPQSNMILLPLIDTTTQLFPTSCPAPKMRHSIPINSVQKPKCLMMQCKLWNGPFITVIYILLLSVFRTVLYINLLYSSGLFDVRVRLGGHGYRELRNISGTISKLSLGLRDDH